MFKFLLHQTHFTTDGKVGNLLLVCLLLESTSTTVGL